MKHAVPGVLLFLVLGWAGALSPARAEHRAALLIGNSAYAGAELASPPRDIRAVGAALQKRGFTVTHIENVTAEKMRAAIKTFALSIPERGTALVYFSGYTVPTAYWRDADPQRDNVLLPVDGDPAAPLLLRGYKTETNTVLNMLSQEPDTPQVPGRVTLQQRGGSALNILIVDGCYRHPRANSKLPEGLLKAGTLAADSLRLYGGGYGEYQTPPAEGLSPFASKWVAALESAQPLSRVFETCSDARECSSTLDLSFLDAPASSVIQPPGTLTEGTQAGQEWVDAWGMVFCWCPPGAFTMGSDAREAGRQNDEGLADVEFPHGFWIGKYELTHRNASALTGFPAQASATHKLHPLNRLQHAVRDSAKQYHPGTSELILDKLNQTPAPPGWYYDLPTEAEWEYAARAGTQAAYWFGNDPAQLARYGNFADRALRESSTVGEYATRFFGKAREKQAGLFTFAHKHWDDGTVTMAWVGSYPPNPWGLHDMHGNVSECTATPYDPARIPVDISGDLKLVHRPTTKGGSWVSTADYCRAAARGKLTERNEENFEGLRLVLRKKREGRPAPSPRWIPLIPSECHTASGTQAAISADGSVLIGGSAAKDTYTLKAALPPGNGIRAVRLEALADPTLPGDGPGRFRDGSFALGEFVMRFRTSSASDTPWHAVSWMHCKSPEHVSNNIPLHAIDGKPDTVWSVRAARDRAGRPVEALFFATLPRVAEADGARWTHPSRRDTSFVLPPADATVECVLEFPNLFALGKFRLSVTSDVVSP